MKFSSRNYRSPARVTSKNQKEFNLHEKESPPLKRGFTAARKGGGGEGREEKVADSGKKKKKEGKDAWSGEKGKRKKMEIRKTEHPSRHKITRNYAYVCRNCSDALSLSAPTLFPKY